MTLGTSSIYQSAISVWFRGPEWAFAVRQGDMAALERVMETCSRFWGGANALIIPVTRGGRPWRLVEECLEVHPVEACFVDSGVDADAAAKMQQILGGQVRQWSALRQGRQVDDWELPPMHPGWSNQNLALPRELAVPAYANKRMRRIVLASWGHIDPEQREDYERVFQLHDALGPTADGALLAGQLEGTSPLELSTRSIRSYQVNASFERSLFVFHRGSFNELVHFWNLRSRTRTHGESPLLIGLPCEALVAPTLAPLSDWIRGQRFTDVEPDLGLIADPTDLPAADAALQELGFQFDSGNRVRMSHNERPPDRPLSYGHFGTHLGRSLKRGAVSHLQITVVDGQASFRPPRPETFGPRSAHHIRLSIEGLPLAFPLTDQLAAQVTSNGFASPEGVSIITNAWAGDGYLQVRVPEPWQALEVWAQSRGWEVQRSSSGRYAQALLDRLGGAPALESLASDAAVKVLHALTPLSRPKLAQRVVARAKEITGVQLDEALLAEELKKDSAFLEVPARTVSEICGAAELTKAKALSVLADLVEPGFVRRGTSICCPVCEYRETLALEDLSERVSCRACGHQFVLPVLSGRSEERPQTYRLDGLMARAMDQDLLPELLLLRALLDRMPANRAAWVGVEFRRGDRKVEVDAVVADGQKVWLGEAKLAASGLGDAQLSDLLDLAAENDALPVLGALQGDFEASQSARIMNAGGLVLRNSDLLTG